MGVRVRLKIRSRRAEAVTSALVSSGFESSEPEIILPPTLASILEKRKIAVVEYRIAGGGFMSSVRIGELRVKLVLEDREREEVTAVGTMLPGEEEVFISDRLASALGIVILDPYEGLWCLRDESGRKTRRSVLPQIWR